MRIFPAGPFLTPKRKLLDLLVLGISDLVIYFIWGSWEVVALFSLGFIWNWVASQDLDALFENRRYRFSMVKLVKNLQQMILTPLQNAPRFLSWLAACLPAGIFWGMVIYVNDALMPWWATFLGSAGYQLLQLEMISLIKHKESAP